MKLSKQFGYSTWRNLSSTSSAGGLQPFEAIPGPTPLPFVGNVWRYLPVIGEYKLDTLFENAQFNRQRYGPIVRETITKNHTILHLFDPIDVKSFMKQDGPTPFRRSHRALLKYRRENCSRYRDGGLFCENGPNWLRLRKLFQLREITLKAPLMDQITVKTIDKIRGSIDRTFVIEDFEAIINRWALVSSLTLFLDYDVGEQIDSQQVDNLISSLHDELAAIDGTEIKSERWNDAPNKCPYYRKLAKSESYLYDFVSNRIEYLIANSLIKPNSFLCKWLVESKMDKLDVTTYVIDLILAGLHTTSYTTIFLLNNIANIDEIFKSKLRAELKASISSKQITAEDLNKMILLKNCLKETLRLNPVSIGTGRLTQNDMIIRNYRVPKNIMVIAQNQVICRDSSIYEEPNDFKPERWSLYRESPKKFSITQVSWKPYGFGSRVCIGQNAANLQIAIFAARVLQHFDIQFMNQIKTKTTLIHNIDGHVAVQLKQLV